VSIQDFGWNSCWQSVWQSCEKEDAWVPARVVSQHRGLWCIVTDCHARGFVECWATPSGRMYSASSAGGGWPAVGDWVGAAIPSDGQHATIHGVLPRRTKFVRKTAGRRVEQQVIAANVDVALIVSALDSDFNRRRLERYLAQCWESGAWPVIVLNKAEQCSDVVARTADVQRIAPSTPVLALSARTGEGIAALNPYLIPGQTIVMLGSSGVGKSTLVNHLLGANVQAVEPVRRTDGRGRHTTTSRQLLRLSCGALVIDTPGLRELALWDAADGVQQTFADVDDLARECRFRDCRHESEPGCAVRAAVAAGTLDQARLENRRKLEREQEFVRRKMDLKAASKARHGLKAMMRSVRKKYQLREKEGKP
jgi:ribosome biogenesis GTPase / thiamine phosphate phosphatase